MICSGAVYAAEAVTITGDGKCAKCALNETKTCQNVIEVEENGKKTTYYLVHEGASKKYHGTVCKATVKTKATGEVTEKDGKKIMTATSVEKAE